MEFVVRLDGPKEVVIAVSVSDLADTTTIRKHSLRHIEDIVACGVCSASTEGAE